MSHTILLEPLEPFFFGGSQTFGRLGDENGGSYLARSELFPQQSAVLGMLRKELMIQAGGSAGWWSSPRSYREGPWNNRRNAHGGAGAKQAQSVVPHAGALCVKCSSGSGRD